MACWYYETSPPRRGRGLRAAAGDRQPALRTKELAYATPACLVQDRAPVDQNRLPGNKATQVRQQVQRRADEVFGALHALEHAAGGRPLIGRDRLLGRLIFTER